ncbi:MAG: hypothetical protein F6J93_24180 [Oscillatoria sp. SIO1A7]|nr:hypothetical protein [Oscillatoria sp. SIO1A7]
MGCGVSSSPFEAATFMEKILFNSYPSSLSLSYTLIKTPRPYTPHPTP